MSEEQEDDSISATFIITCFVKTQVEPKPKPEDIKAPLLAAISQSLLIDYHSLVDIFEITTPEIVWQTPRIIQYRYNVPADFPKFSELRHHRLIRSYEQDNQLEIIFDTIPYSQTINKDVRRPLRLALFDMDSTLINEEVIDELARSIDKTDVVSAITARAMNGEIDFETSLRQRVAMLKGVRTDVWDTLKQTVTIANGARELIQGLKKAGVLTGVVSGGFAPMAEWLKGELGLDRAFANHLLTSPPTPSHPYPHLTGTLSPDHPLVTPELKRELLRSLAASHSVPITETFAVGDGSNDLLMLHAAGLGIAYNAKQKVQEKAPMRLNSESLADLLYLFKFDDPAPLT